MKRKAKRWCIWFRFDKGKDRFGNPWPWEVDYFRVAGDARVCMLFPTRQDAIVYKKAVISQAHGLLKSWQYLILPDGQRPAA